MKVELENPTALDYFEGNEDYSPGKAIDRDSSTIFALKGGADDAQKDGWWRADFGTKGAKIIKVLITTSSQEDHIKDASNAKIFIGETECPSTLPDEI